jgi:energy-coupling factor transport system permease protein
MPRELLQSGDRRGGLVLDPRTKILLVLTGSLILVAGGYGGVMTVIRPVLAVLPMFLLLASRRWTVSAAYFLAYSLAYLGDVFLVPHTRGLVNFLVVASCGLFARFLPILAAGGYLVSTTTVSQFMAAMGRMGLSEKITIPLSVVFRFFPTLGEEYMSISDAMRMRGISLAGGNPLAMLEYRLVPMMVCCVKIGEELSAAAITRGLGAPVKRTNIGKIGFQFQDIVVMAICLASLAAAFLQWFGKWTR